MEDAEEIEYWGILFDACTEELDEYTCFLRNKNQWTDYNPRGKLGSLVRSDGTTLFIDFRRRIFC